MCENAKQILTSAVNGVAMKNSFLEEFELRREVTKYQKAITLDPNNAGPFNGLAGAYFGLGDFERAIEYYQKAIKLDPNEAGPFNGIASAYSGLGDFNKAIEFYQKAVKVDPDDASAWFYLGSSYLALERPEEALTVFKEALKIHKNNPFIMNGVGLARYKIKKSSKPAVRLTRVDIKKNFRI